MERKRAKRRKGKKTKKPTTWINNRTECRCACRRLLFHKAESYRKWCIKYFANSILRKNHTSVCRRCGLYLSIAVWMLRNIGMRMVGRHYEFSSIVSHVAGITDKQFSTMPRTEHTKHSSVRSKMREMMEKKRVSYTQTHAHKFMSQREWVSGVLYTRFRAFVPYHCKHEHLWIHTHTHTQSKPVREHFPTMQ